MKKVLIILPNNLGDVIMALPVLGALRKKDPACRITWFVEKGYEAGLVNNPNCDEIYAFDRKTVCDTARSPQWRSSVELMKKTAVELKSKSFDRVINLFQHPYGSFLASLVSCNDTAGQRFLREGNHTLPDAWTQYLYAIPFARRFNRLHATDIYKKIARAGIGEGERYLFITEEEKKRAGEYLSANGLDPSHRNMVVLQPGAAYAAKRWPMEHFAALGKMLEQDGCRLIVTGAPAEAEIAQSLGAHIGEAALVTAGKITFRETIALLPHARGCVTGDTAIMHAAAGAGCRVYALFGPTNPVETGPYGEGHYVFCGRCPSRPCFCFDCKSKLCMKSILPAEVHAIIRHQVAEHSTCDIYKTRWNKHATLCLEPVSEHGQAYYDEIGAMLTVRSIDPGYAPEPAGTGESASALKAESEIFIGALDQMARALAGFLEKRKPDALGKFEGFRKNAAALRGIGMFWTALLNVRLNSVPLLDPVGGVSESLNVCRSTGDAIRSAIAVLP